MEGAAAESIGWPKMREAFDAAHFSEAAAIYDAAVEHHEPPFAVMLLRARILLKSDASRALDLLLKHRSAVVSDGDRHELELYIGIGFARVGDFAMADKHFECAQARLEPDDCAGAATLAYHQARRFLLERRTADAWHSHDLSLLDRSLAGRIRSEHLQSFIYSQEERYADQAHSLIRVLEMIGANVAAHVEDWYWAVHSLAGLARELPIDEARRVAQAQLDVEREWSPDFAWNRFQALRALAWCKALDGDYLGCFRDLRSAQTIVEAIPDGHAWQTMLLLDRAVFARHVGETQWAANEVAAAEELAQSINWNQRDGEQRIALLLLAEFLAADDPEKAAAYVGRFNALDTMRSPLLHFAFDRRLTALGDYVRGIVKLHCGNPHDAVPYLESAWRTFDQTGYDWRAGKAALGLVDATRDGSWNDAARAKLLHYTRSWLWGLYSARLAVPPQPHSPELSPTQQRVFELLCSGMSTDEISKTMRRSRYTVRNHLKLIFKSFGVRSRTALIAKAAQSGLIK
jgi:DNA-binding CsgD family transcriptional regulator